MDLGIELHALAGVGALVMGAGVSAGSLGLRRSRVFALLCASLALWNLGVVAVELGFLPKTAGDRLFLAGSCASGPLGLELAFLLTGLWRRIRQGALWAARMAALGLWLTLFVPGFGEGSAWSYTAIAVLGASFLVALGLVALAALDAVRPGERAVFNRLFAGAGLAILGGLSDFVPRGTIEIPLLGPLTLLLFLIVLGSAVVSFRFLDIHVLLVRSSALIAMSAVGTLLMLAVTRLMGLGFLPVYLVMLPVLAAAVPLGQAIARRSRGSSELAVALNALSGRLPRAQTRHQVRGSIEHAQALLPWNLSWVAFLGTPGSESWRRVYGRGGQRLPDELPVESPLPLVLRERQRPMTAPELLALAREGGQREERCRAALREIDALGLELVVPLTSDAGVVGVLGLGGDLPPRALGPEVATALMAVGQQALDAFERIAANEAVRRQEAMAAVGEMAGGLAHEVQNPVAAIRGAAQLLLAGGASETSREMLTVIEEETGRLGRVVREFLEYARPAEPSFEDFSLRSLILETERALQVGGWDFQLSLALESDELKLRGDRDQWRRVFENLLRNGCEAALKLGKRPHLELGAEPVEGQRRLRLVIRDNGCGVSEEDASQVFAPFFTSGKPGGTGLGLALVQRVVEAHSGSISVENRPQGGASFCIEVPSLRGESRLEGRST